MDNDFHVQFIVLISLINISTFVPIALIMSLEFARFVQAQVISNDDSMKDEDLTTTVQCSAMNEELGRVHYVCSDKTGTLTCNRMIFKKIVIDDTIFG